MKKINESFQCIYCGKDIPIAHKTCRNHCPYCFISLHLDWDAPWDRAANCWGIMYPIEYQLKNSDYKILFQCCECKKQHWNKRAEDDEIVNLPSLIQKYKENFQ